MVQKGETLLEVKNLSYRYPPPREILAVNDVSFNIKSGELVAIIGQNGSGKSTLAKCISGFIKSKMGSIKIQGQTVLSLNTKKRAQLVGYVFQNPDHQLFKDFVWDDVAFGLQNMGVQGEELNSRVNKILDSLYLSEFRKIHPMRLAKGDRQRLAIASILAIQPSVIIVDEPTTGQDPGKARDIMDIIRRVTDSENIAAIAITHSMELVAEYADRVIVMGEGKILLDGTPREVFSQPEILAKTYVAPPVISQLGLAIGLNPLPLTVEEAKLRIVEVLKN